jgi:hypothetical protein
VASRNPYDWRRYHPEVEVVRSGVDAVAEDLAAGGSFVLLAGRGMGKSVFLRQVHARLELRSGVRAILFPAPPAPLTVEGCLRALAQKLGVDVGRPLDTYEVVQAYFGTSEAPGRLVLLYDEFDRYGGRGSPVDTTPGREFFNNLETMLRDTPQIGVLAAGSLGVFGLRDTLGSSFLARAARLRLRPFTAGELARLARPFADRGEPLADETLEALALATGGNPALATYGFQHLWPRPKPTFRDVTLVFSRFKSSQIEFLRDFQLSFSDPHLSPAPQRVWELVQSAPGPISHADLKRACASADGILRLSFADVLDLLEAAGLVEITGSTDADPVTVRPITSVLTLPRTPSPAPSFRDRLRQDLESLLGRLHASSADFFRPGAGGEGKRLVPESVFTTFLALGLDLLGWQAEREAQHGAGRTDLKLRWNGADELAVVEVKIWGRHDYLEVQRQVESYWSAGVGAGAVTMLADAVVPDWPEQYRRWCLDGQGREVAAWSSEVSPVLARFSCRSTTVDGMAAEVDHFLLRVPRRG